MRKVAFILGTGHCGSTLIDLVLGSHNDIFSLGEISKLSNQKIRRKQEFWTPDLMKNLEKHFRFRKNRLLSWEYHRFPASMIFENRKDFYTKIFDKTKTEILVDSSKKIQWIRRGVAHLKNDEIKPLVIHMKREPIAVVNSYFKKYKNRMTMDEIVEFVGKSIIQNEEYFVNIPEENKIILDYEIFCENPERETRKICKFLNINYFPSMLEYWKFDHFNISGNSGTNSLIQKYKGEDTSFNPQRKDFDHYKNHPLAIKLDERWRKDLSIEQIEYVNSKLDKKFS